MARREWAFQEETISWNNFCCGEVRYTRTLGQELPVGGHPVWVAQPVGPVLVQAAPGNVCGTVRRVFWTLVTLVWYSLLILLAIRASILWDQVVARVLFGSDASLNDKSDGLENLIMH